MSWSSHREGQARAAATHCKLVRFFSTVHFSVGISMANSLKINESLTEVRGHALGAG